MTRIGAFSPLALLVAAFLGLTSLSSRAEQSDSSAALQLLQKVASSTQKLTYTGVFVYQSGNRSEISRITRLIENGDEYERLEVLDGSPREVVRHNNEVSCYLPDNKLLIVEHRAAHHFFPTLIPGNLASLTGYYLVRKGAVGRIAGVHSHQIIIEPKDGFRFGHRFWIEPNSGLLLKASLIGEDGTVLESFAFTEVKIGGPVSKAMVEPKSELKGADWKIQHVKANKLNADTGQWVFRHPLPGFHRVSDMKRQLRPGITESTQLIFSDGLAALSVFIEPLDGQAREEPSAFSVGAVNVYKRQIADYRITLMGDVPVTALRYFGDGIEPRKK